jgi:Ni/Fe-hydrogenase subunit HybB-like protein
VEYLVVVGIIALGALLVTLAVLWLPIREHATH